MLMKRIGKMLLALSFLLLTVSPGIAQRRPVRKTHELRLGEQVLVDGVVRQGRVQRHLLRIGTQDAQLTIGSAKVGFRGKLTVFSPTLVTLATSTPGKGVQDLELTSAGDYLLEIAYPRDPSPSPPAGQYFLFVSLDRKTIVLGEQPLELQAQLRPGGTDRYVIRINEGGRLLIQEIKTNFSGELIVRKRKDPFGDPRDFKGGDIIHRSNMNAGFVEVLIPGEDEYILSVRNNSPREQTSAAGFYMFRGSFRKN